MGHQADVAALGRLGRAAPQRLEARPFVAWLYAVYRDGIGRGGDLARAMRDADEAHWTLEEAVRRAWVLPLDPALGEPRNADHPLRLFRRNPDPAAWTSMPPVLRELVGGLAPYASVPPWRMPERPSPAVMAGRLTRARALEGAGRMAS